MLAPIRIQVDVGKWKFQAILCHESHLEDDAEMELDEEAGEDGGLSRLDAHVALSDDDPPPFGFAPIPVYDDEEAW